MIRYCNVKAPFAGLSLLVVTGCAFTDKGSLHVYEPPVNQTKKELVSYPLDPENSDWILKACETGAFAYRDKDREFTPYGVVIKVIECVPHSEESGQNTQRGPDTYQFRFTGDLEHIPEAVRARYPEPFQEEEQEERDGEEKPQILLPD